MDWQLEVTELGPARRYRLTQSGKPLSFKSLFELLGSDVIFSKFYSRSLVESGFQAFFWEHPPLVRSNLDEPAEFVLLPAPALEGAAATPGPFRAQFARQPGRDIIAFNNLGGDALLIAPAPGEPLDAHAHLGAFLRGVAPEQTFELWRVTAQAVLHRLSDTPLWLSTSGLGVAWLHLRLDARPKYYQHAPYRALSL